MTAARAEPARDAPERQLLDGWLDYHRATLLLKCEGLSDSQLALRSVPPSRLSLLGLVRHMVDVERGWFLIRLRGPGSAHSVYRTEAEPDGDFDAAAEADAAADLDTYRRTLTEVRTALSRYPNLDYLAPVPSDSGARYSLRWIYTHMIEEYARHNGHADLLRERIDGVVGE